MNISPDTNNAVGGGPASKLLHNATSNNEKSPSLCRRCRPYEFLSSVFLPKHRCGASYIRDARTHQIYNMKIKAIVCV